jgi:hypothetical protein
MNKTGKVEAINSSGPAPARRASIISGKGLKVPTWVLERGGAGASTGGSNFTKSMALRI